MAAAGNNRFAVTCRLMRQYMREHQHQQMGLAGVFQQAPPLQRVREEAEEMDNAKTMQFFPMAQPSQEPVEAPAKVPLTIIYKGRVLVFPDVPADKAEELIQMAESSSASQALENGEQAVPENSAAVEPSAEPSDMPIARNASLQRFLQKRKHRTSATDDYDKRTASPEPEKDVAAGKRMKDEHAASWLGL